MFKRGIFAFLMLASIASHAGLVKYTATSAEYGELGELVVDEAVLASDTSLEASQFYDFNFHDPLSGASISLTNVMENTGYTYFCSDDEKHIVSGGGIKSFSSVEGISLWIAGKNRIEFREVGSIFQDVTWIGTDYIVPTLDLPSDSLVPVSEPGALALLGLGLLALSRSRRNSKR